MAEEPAGPSATDRRKAYEKQQGSRRQLTRKDYAEHGYTSVNRAPGQGEMFPAGTVQHDPQRNPRITQWHELSPQQRRETSRRMSEKYGVTMESAAKEHGHLMDDAFRRSQHEQAKGPEPEPGAPIHGEGQRWYHGGEGTAAQATGTQARVHGVPFQTEASMRAVVSPRSDAFKELQSAHAAATRVQQKPRSKYVHGAEPGEKGFIPGTQAIQQNVQKAAEIYRQSLRGTHPHDVMVEASARGARRGQPALETVGPKKGRPKIRPAVGGGKVEGYEESYAHPHSARRLPVDVHAAAGLAPHLEKHEQEDMMDIPHAHAFLTEAMTRSAGKRGLGGAEGQSLAWHELRNYRNAGVPVQAGHAQPRRETEGQRRLF